MTDLPTVTIDSVSVAGKEYPVLHKQELAPDTAEFREDLMKLIAKHGGSDPRAQLAAASFCVGAICITQNPQTMTQARANAIIQTNINVGQVAMLEMRAKRILTDAVAPDRQELEAS